MDFVLRRADQSLTNEKDRRRAFRTLQVGGGIKIKIKIRIKMTVITDGSTRLMTRLGLGLRGAEGPRWFVAVVGKPLALGSARANERERISSFQSAH